MKYHPDRNSGDDTAEVKFKEAKEAYEVLKDTEKRAAYDRFGHEGLRGAAAGGGFSGADAFSDIFGDVFGDIFGAARRGGGRNQVFRGADLRYELELSSSAAISGSSWRGEIW